MEHHLSNAGDGAGGKLIDKFKDASAVGGQYKLAVGLALVCTREFILNKVRIDKISARTHGFCHAYLSKSWRGERWVQDQHLPSGLWPRRPHGGCAWPRARAALRRAVRAARTGYLGRPLQPRHSLHVRKDGRGEERGLEGRKQRIIRDGENQPEYQRRDARPLGKQQSRSGSVAPWGHAAGAAARKRLRSIRASSRLGNLVCINA
jgi:hypothetical protein